MDFTVSILISKTATSMYYYFYLFTEGSTGVFTGSLYMDPYLLQGGYYGENRNFTDGSTIAQKTHHE